jgi:DNA-binding NtrC family response regulator
MAQKVKERAQETVVVVDDQPVVLDFCVTVLSREGLKVLSASTARDALSFFAADRTRVDLALVDIVMPGMSGVEFVKALEKCSPDTRIVLMSGYSPEEIKRVVGADASHYRSIWKPFEPQTLVRMVRNALDAPAPNQDNKQGSQRAGC